jgi:hypothetical protein
VRLFHHSDDPAIARFEAKAGPHAVPAAARGPVRVASLRDPFQEGSAMGMLRLRRLAVESADGGLERHFRQCAPHRPSGSAAKVTTRASR